MQKRIRKKTAKPNRQNLKNNPERTQERSARPNIQRVPLRFCPRLPEARVIPTPFRLVRVEAAGSSCGSFRKAFLLSVCTALGVLILTRLVSCGKNLPRCQEKKGRKGGEEKENRGR